MDADNSIERFGMADENHLAMVLFLISEGVFFAFLIIAYIYFHGSETTGPNAVNSLDPSKTGVFTVALLASSFTMWRAEKNHARRNFASFRNWMLATIGLGTIFMVGQGREYFHLYQSDVTVSRNIFSSAFFTLTGFHGLHVMLGLIALLIFAGLAWRDFENLQRPAVRTIALYWHFVDWVWVVIFTVVYLWAVL